LVEQKFVPFYELNFCLYHDLMTFGRGCGKFVEFF